MSDDIKEQIKEDSKKANSKMDVFDKRETFTKDELNIFADGFNMDMPDVNSGIWMDYKDFIELSDEFKKNPNFSSVKIYGKWRGKEELAEKKMELFEVAMQTNLKLETQIGFIKCMEEISENNSKINKIQQATMNKDSKKNEKAAAEIRSIDKKNIQILSQQYESFDEWWRNAYSHNVDLESGQNPIAKKVFKEAKDVADDIDRVGVLNSKKLDNYLENSYRKQLKQRMQYVPEISPEEKKLYKSLIKDIRNDVDYEKDELKIDEARWNDFRDSAYDKVRHIEEETLEEPIYSTFTKPNMVENSESAQLSDNIIDSGSNILADEKDKRELEPSPKGLEISQNKEMETFTTENNNNYQLISENADGYKHEYCLVNGQKEGFETIFDKDGNLTSIEMYEKGKKLELPEGNKINYLREETDGQIMIETKINGKTHGLFVLRDKQGKIQEASFFNKGILIDSTDVEKLNTKQTNNKKDQSYLKMINRLRGFDTAQKNKINPSNKQNVNVSSLVYQKYMEAKIYS